MMRLRDNLNRMKKVRSYKGKGREEDYPSEVKEQNLPLEKAHQLESGKEEQGKYKNYYRRNLLWDIQENQGKNMIRHLTPGMRIG